MKWQLLLVLLLIASPVSAELIVNKYTNDFTASSPYNEQLKLCSCETKVDRIIVENTGSFYAEFHVKIETSYPRNIRIVPQEFQLAPKHFREVLVYIEDSCGVTGTFGYDVLITNSYGRQERISRTIRIDQCQTVGLRVEPRELTVGLCEPATYEVTVSNIGTFPDEYTLSLGPYDDVAEIEQRSFRLEPGASRAQEATLNFSCDVFGEKTIPFTVRAGSGMAATAQRQLTITNDYAFSLDMPTSLEVCARTSTQVPITISNQADVPDRIGIAADLPQFAAIAGGERVIAVPAGGERNLTLELSPGSDAIGTHEITVSATDIGGVTHTRTARLNVANCYDVAAQIRIDPVTPADSLTACCGARTFYANVRNDGDREQVFSLVLAGPSFFALEETTVRLQPGQNANVPIRADLPCTDETYAFSVIAFPARQPHVNASATFTVESQTQRTCRMVQIDDDEVVLRENQEVLPILVKHTGIEGGTYSVDVNSTILRALESEITLVPGEQEAIHLVPVVNLTEAEKGRYIVNPVFTLQEPQQIEYIESVGVELRGKGLWARFLDWLERIPWNVVGICGWIILILAVLLVLAAVGLFAMYGGWTPVDALPRRTLVGIRTAILVAVLLLLVSLAFLRFPAEELRYERVADTSDPTVIEMYQNTEVTLDLDRYFEDPDLDILEYTATQPRDIRVTIEGSLMTLRPEHNFVGENTLIVTASDRKGGFADSPMFIIRVIPQRELGFFGWLNVWCGYIIVLLLIMVLLVGFLMTLTIKERRPTDFKRENVIVVVGDRGRSGGKKRATRAKTSGAPAAARRAPRSGQSGDEIAFVGSKTGNMVHTPDCTVARRIPRGKRVAFSSKREALNAGLVPCRLCRPFGR